MAAFSVNKLAAHKLEGNFILKHFTADLTLSVHIFSSYVKFQYLIGCRQTSYLLIISETTEALARASSAFAVRAK